MKYLVVYDGAKVYSHCLNRTKSLKSNELASDILGKDLHDYPYIPIFEAQFIKISMKMDKKSPEK